MHLKVGTLGVLRSFGIVGTEVRSLRSMGDDESGFQQFPELLSESDQPLLTTAVALQEGRSVLPVDVHSVKVVIIDEFSQFFGAVINIIPSRSRVFSGSESTYNQLDTGICVLLLQISLDLRVVVTEYSCSHIVDEVAPNQSGVNGSAGVCPKCQGNIVEWKSSGGVTGDGEALGDCRRRPPLGEAVNVCEFDGYRSVHPRRLNRDGTFLVELVGLCGRQQADAHYGSEHYLMDRNKIPSDLKKDIKNQHQNAVRLTDRDRNDLFMWPRKHFTQFLYILRV